VRKVIDFFNAVSFSAFLEKENWLLELGFCGEIYRRITFFISGSADGVCILIPSPPLGPKLDRDYMLLKPEAVSCSGRRRSNKREDYATF